VKEIATILDAVQRGDPSASGELLPLVYDELRRLAAWRLKNEKPGQTLQATALVHEAYLRLVGKEDPHWNGRRHFFNAAAEAMRRILIERARQKKSLRGGGQLQRVELNETEISAPLADDDLLTLHEALDQLAALDLPAAELIKLRFFVGLTHQDAAEILGMNRTAADRTWLFARAWLFERIRPEGLS
jgi:RNA polymerase sigma factor (TIGR02999 family)